MKTLFQNISILLQEFPSQMWILLFAQVVMRESLISSPGRLTEVNVQHTFVLLFGPNSEKSTFFAPLEYIRLEKPKRGRNTHIEFKELQTSLRYGNMGKK